jgi:hypothetical protein
MAPLAALTRGRDRALAATVAAAGQIRRTALHALAATLRAQGAFHPSQRYEQALAALAMLRGSLHRALPKSFAATVADSAVLTRRTGRRLVAQSTLAASMARSAAHGLRRAIITQRAVLPRALERSWASTIQAAGQFGRHSRA